MPIADYRAPPAKVGDEVLSDLNSRRRTSEELEIGNRQSVCVENTGGVVAHKTTDIKNPPPSDQRVFHDERPDSINDGFFAVSMVSNDMPDMPASYHTGAAGNAYADGHADIHAWKTDPFTRQDVNRPTWNITWGGMNYPNNVDGEWMRSHSGQYSASYVPIP